MGLFTSNDFPQVREEQKYSRMKIRSKLNEKKPTKDLIFNSLLMFDAINKYYSLKDILEDIGCDDLGATNCYCPFHNEIKGLSKPSAKYYEDSDTLYCYQENRSFTAYHGIKILLKGDIKVYFNEAWQNLDSAVKEELIEKYGSGEIAESSSKILEPYENVFEMFINGNIDFKKYKGAIRKILYELYSEERKEIADKLFGNEKKKESKPAIKIKNNGRDPSMEVD